MSKFIVFVEYIVIAQACSTNKTLFSILRRGEEEELFLYLCTHQINVRVEKRMVLRKKDVQHISCFLRPVSRFSAIFPYRDV